MSLAGRTMLFSVLGLAAFGSGGWLASASWRVESLRGELRTLEEQQGLLELRVTELRRDAAQPVPLVEIARTPSIPAEPGTAVFLRSLERMAMAVQVVLEDVRGLESSTPGRAGFEILGRGQPTDLCSFLAAIEGLERLVVIESTGLRAVRSGEVQFTCTVTTYHQQGVR